MRIVRRRTGAREIKPAFGEACVGVQEMEIKR